MARIRKHRSKWQVLYRDPATKTERSAGVFTRKGDAQRVQREVEHRLTVGRWIDPDRDGSGITLRDWWQDVEPTWLGRGGSTRTRDRSYFRTLIDPYLGDTALSAIDAVTLENWVGELNRAGYSPATIAKAAQLLRRVLQEAVDHHKVVRNPADRLTGKLPASRPTSRRISPKPTPIASQTRLVTNGVHLFFSATPPAPAGERPPPYGAADSTSAEEPFSSTPPSTAT